MDNSLASMNPNVHGSSEPLLRIALEAIGALTAESLSHGEENFAPVRIPQPCQPNIKTVAYEAPRETFKPIPLTPTHQTVLRSMVLGLSTKQIAYELHRSPKTIAAHRMQIMERLHIHNLAGLIFYALKHRLIEPTDYDRLHSAPPQRHPGRLIPRRS